jgi:putative membrane protein
MPSRHITATPLGAALTALLVAATSACAQTRVTKEAGGAVAPTPAPTPASAAALAPLPPNPMNPTEAMWADPAIAATASRSNFQEIEPSRLAVQRATTPALKEYAQMMIDEHVALETQMRAMLQAKGVTPQDNGFSLQLHRNLPPMLAMMESKTGVAFDKEYAQHMISSHMLTLHTLDTTLIPETDDAR